MKDVLTEAMDLDGLQKLIDGIANGSIKCLAVDTPIPSVFSHEILNANPYAYLDDAPLEERRARAVEMRRILPDSMVDEFGRLDEKAIAEIKEEIWPDLRDADELHDFLQTVVILPEDLSVLSQIIPDKWKSLFSQLILQKRAQYATIENKRFWLCAERVEEFNLIYPKGRLDKKLPVLPKRDISYEKAILSLIQGWMHYCVPVKATDIQQLFVLPVRSIEVALLQLESSGSVLRGKFTQDVLKASTDELSNWQWCDRRVLSRIYRLTVSTLRKQVEAVTAGLFCRWLSHWQHVAPGSQLGGERGLLSVLEQLQGFEIAANAWEKQILAKRVINYDPAWLDHLCMTGSVGWGRLSPHPAVLKKSSNGSNGNHGSENPRVIPTSVAPITFFVRQDSDWMVSHNPKDELDDKSLSAPARSVENYLQQRGASFFPDIVRNTGLLKAEVETALWELVTAGMVTADGFDNLRGLIDPKRRAGQGRGRYIRPRHSTGRWSLLYTDQADDNSKTAEATCRVLLNRYGIVFRDLLARETFTFKWRQLLLAFRSMEARGEIYGGTFVGGFLGEQFALPQALESLRAFRNRGTSENNLTLSAFDPLNLSGIIVPGDRIAAVSGKTITIKD